MLIRFAIENSLSIREEQELSLVASALKDEGADLLAVPDSNFKLLPAAVIYGANASGKSNFLSAFMFFSNAVRSSHTRGGPDTGVARKPFVLQKKWLPKPTKVRVEFILDGIRYEYGFACDDHSFLEEWLHAFPSGKRQRWYDRTSQRKSIYFGKSLRGPSKTIESLMRPNSLYLSVAAQNAHDQLTPIFRYLTNFEFKDAEATALKVQAQFADGTFDPRIIDLLKHADTGISNFRFENLVDSSEQHAFATDLDELIKKHVGSFDLGAKLKDLKKISLAHRAEDKQVHLDLSSESRGTLRLLVLFKEIFETLDRGSLLLIDEIDSSLHTYLVEDVIRLFNSKETNKKGAQLVTTTHDTNLLCGNLLRRDQIWFTEKDQFGATSLYPLTDIRTRNSDNIEKGYLEGRFGAVPFRGPLQNLVGSEN